MEVYENGNTKEQEREDEEIKAKFANIVEKSESHTGSDNEDYTEQQVEMSRRSEPIRIDFVTLGMFIIGE